MDTVLAIYKEVQNGYGDWVLNLVRVFVGGETDTIPTEYYQPCYVWHIMELHPYKTKAQ